MTTKPVMAFDLDETLAGLRHLIRDVMTAEFGHCYPIDQWHSYNIEERFGITPREFLALLEKHHVLERAALEPRALETLELARQLGYHRCIITARGWHPRGREITEQWLERHGLEVDDLHLVAERETKVDTMRRIGSVAYFIDDHPGHVSEAVAADVADRVIVISRPWNAQLNHAHRVECLGEFCELVTESHREAS